MTKLKLMCALGIVLGAMACGGVDAPSVEKTEVRTSKVLCNGIKDAPGCPPGVDSPPKDPLLDSLSGQWCVNATPPLIAQIASSSAMTIWSWGPGICDQAAPDIRCNCLRPGDSLYTDLVSTGNGTYSAMARVLPTKGSCGAPTWVSTVLSLRAITPNLEVIDSTKGWSQLSYYHGVDDPRFPRGSCPLN